MKEIRDFNILIIFNLRGVKMSTNKYDYSIHTILIVLFAMLIIIATEVIDGILRWLLI